MKVIIWKHGLVVEAHNCETGVCCLLIDKQRRETSAQSNLKNIESPPNVDLVQFQE
jgi:hypothetical protein